MLNFPPFGGQDGLWFHSPSWGYCKHLWRIWLRWGVWRLFVGWFAIFGIFCKIDIVKTRKLWMEEQIVVNWRGSRQERRSYSIWPSRASRNSPRGSQTSTSRAVRWEPLAVPELKIFNALLHAIMGLRPKEDIQDYWSTDVLTTSFFAKYMVRNCFI